MSIVIDDNKIQKFMCREIITVIQHNQDSTTKIIATKRIIKKSQIEIIINKYTTLHKAIGRLIEKDKNYYYTLQQTNVKGKE